MLKMGEEMWDWNGWLVPWWDEITMVEGWNVGSVHHDEQLIYVRNVHALITLCQKQHN